MKKHAIVLCTAFALVGCSKSPDNASSSSAPPSAAAPSGVDVPAKDVLDQTIRETLESLVIKRNGPFDMKGKVKEYTIENSFPKKIDGEAWTIYEIKSVLTVDGLSGPADYDVPLMLGFVRRGQKWYSKPVEL